MSQYQLCFSECKLLFVLLVVPIRNPVRRRLPLVTCMSRTYSYEEVWQHEYVIKVIEYYQRQSSVYILYVILLNFKGSGPEWCISSMLYSQDIPLLSRTLDFLTDPHSPYPSLPLQTSKYDMLFWCRVV